MSTAFHPQTDGQSERTIRTLEQMLRCALSEFKDSDWDTLLPYVEMCYNSTASSATEKSPHEIVYGVVMKTPAEILPLETAEEDEEIIVPTVTQHLEKLKSTHDIVSRNLAEA